MEDCLGVLAESGTALGNQSTRSGLKGVPEGAGRCAAGATGAGCHAGNPGESLPGGAAAGCGLSGGKEGTRKPV